MFPAGVSGCAVDCHVDRRVISFPICPSPHCSIQEVPITPNIYSTWDTMGKCIFFCHMLCYLHVGLILSFTLFIVFTWQLDADEAEPSFDEREGQDEYTEMHMPVWPHSSFHYLTWFQAIVFGCTTFSFFHLSVLSLRNWWRNCIYTCIRLISCHFCPIDKSWSPVLVIFFQFIYQRWNVVVRCTCCGGINECMIPSQFKQEAL